MDDGHNVARVRTQKLEVGRSEQLLHARPVKTQEAARFWVDVGMHDGSGGLCLSFSLSLSLPLSTACVIVDLVVIRLPRAQTCGQTLEKLRSSWTLEDRLLAALWGR